MSYQVLARKWRPRTFEEVAGQKHVTRALHNALSLGRLHHAYLFTGTRGIGKTTLARILAKCFNCESGVVAVPCNSCTACQQIDAGRYIDLIEVDAASRTGVENMRELLDNVQYTPSAGAFKIYLIDEVHMLSLSSFNALLKTLEEPPEHIKFFFATTHPQKIPVTILSRCLQFNLLRLPHTLIYEHLAKLLKKENINFEESALNEIAIAADGSVRDALSLLDQAIAYGHGELKNDEVETMLGISSRTKVVDLLAHIANQNTSEAIATCEKLYEAGVDFNEVLEDLISLLHQVSLYQALPTAELLPLFDKQDVAKLADRLTPEDAQIYYQFALNGKRDMAVISDYKTAFEMVVLKMACFIPINLEQNLPASSTTIQTPLKETPSPQTQLQTTAHTKNLAATDKAQYQRSLSTCQNAEDWMQLIEAMGLSGATRGICCNALLTVRSETEAILDMTPETKTLCTNERQTEIQSALEQLVGHAVSLSFQYNNPEQTPVNQKTHEQLERQHQAELAIENDNYVKALKEQFGAELVPNTTKPI